MANTGKAEEKQTTPDEEVSVQEWIDLAKKQQETMAKMASAMAQARPLGNTKITPDDPRSKVHLEKRPPKGGAFIVKMPTQWSGTRMGIVFRNGIGIIDEERHNCDELAFWMQADYGYKVLPADEKEVNKMRKALDGVELVEPAQTTAEKLLDMGALGRIGK